MNIIILGAGRVGESVAESLVSEQNDITVIDQDPARLRLLEERLDLRGVVGNGIQPSVLQEAGAKDADMLIACAAADSLLVNHTIAEFRDRLPDAQMRVVALYRQDAQVDAAPETRILPGDEVFVLADTRKIRIVLAGIHKTDKPVQRLMLAGGGKVGLRLARILASQYDVKLIERDKKRCEYLASQLPSSTLILNGDGADEDLLHEENVGEMDLFLALTSDDEDNIMSAMLAKRMGARRVMALINRRAYADMMQGSTIDIAISPAQTVIGELLAHLRRGDVVAVHSLRRGAAEALEGIARGDHKTSKLVGRRVEEIKLPQGVSMGAIVRGEGKKSEVLMPHHDTLIEADDHIILFIPNKRDVRAVEKLFQVSATFFG